MRRRGAESRDGLGGMAPVDRIAAMPARVMALLLCVVLLWTGLGASAAPQAAVHDASAVPSAVVVDLQNPAPSDDSPPAPPQTDGLPSVVLGFVAVGGIFVTQILPHIWPVFLIVVVGSALIFMARRRAGRDGLTHRATLLNKED